MTPRSLAKTLLLGFVLCSAGTALAHVTLLSREAAPGAPYKAVFVVPHGCGGSATVRLAVTIPPGVLLVKPMAKPGWQIDVTREPYAKPWASSHGAKLTEGVSGVVWSGGRLPDSLYDEFVMMTFLSSELAPGATLAFPAIQTCETGEHRWVQAPAAAQSDHSDEPAPSVRLVPADAIKMEHKP